MAVSSTLKSAIKPLIVGYGSPIRQDDGMGWRAAELLRQALPTEIATVIEDHQLTPELVTSLKETGLVIFLDAAADLSPGTIRLQALRPAKVEPWSHHILPEQLLKLAEQVNGNVPRAFLITGGVQDMNLCQQLTATGEMCAAGMADLARRLILTEPRA
jgi:hydrogenase maturation protease